MSKRKKTTPPNPSPETKQEYHDEPTTSFDAQINTSNRKDRDCGTIFTNYLGAMLPSKQLLGNIWRVASPFFCKKNYPLIFSAGTVNILTPLISSYLTIALSEKLKDKDESSEQIFSPMNTILLATMPLLLSSARNSINDQACRSLNNSIKNTLIADYLSEETDSLSMQQHSLKAKSLPPLQDIMPRQAFDFSRRFMNLSIGTSSHSFTILMSLLTSYNLVGVKPTLIVALISGATTFGIIKMSELNKKTMAEGEKSFECLNRNLALIEHNSQQISALSAMSREQKELQSYVEDLDKDKLKTTTIFFLVNSFSLLAFTAYPNILRSIPLSSYPEGTSQQNIVVFAMQFIQMLNSMQFIATTTMERFQFLENTQKLGQFHDFIDEVKEFRDNSPLKIKYDSKKKNIEFKGLTIAIPEHKKEDKAPTLLAKAHSTLEQESLHIITNNSFTLKAGKIYRLNGESGIGKTTFFKTCNNSWPYASGEIIFPCKKEEVYYMNQKLFIRPRTSLLDNLIYPQEKPASFKQKALAKELLAELGLSNKISSLEDNSQDLSRTLSGGEQQRIAFARIFLHEPKPKIIFMDEIISAIDRINSKIIIKMIKTQLKDTTIIFSDHTIDKIAGDKPDKTREKKSTSDSSTSSSFATSFSVAEATLNFDKSKKQFIVSYNRER